MSRKLILNDDLLIEKGLSFSHDTNTSSKLFNAVNKHDYNSICKNYPMAITL